MKVLLIDVNCKEGSTGKIVYSLYSRLKDGGDESAICYGRGSKFKDSNIYKFGVNCETYLHAFLTRITGYTGCFSYFSTRRLIRFIKKFKPDVVHIHELHAYFINISKILNYLKNQNIKVVHTLHCNFSYTGKCGYHLDCEKWKSGCGKCPRLKEYVSTAFFDHTKKMFKSKKNAFSGFKDMTIVCPSNWLANYAKLSFLNQYPIKVIPNGINTEVFYLRDANSLREKFKINNDEKVIVAVAPNLMSQIKGGQWVLKLASRMIRDKVKFILIGVDKCDFESPSNTIILGRTNNQEELAAFYSLADVFLICSEKENFPTTCLEAQCCGTAICGFDVGGTKETSVFDKNNFVEYGDIDALKDAVYKTLNLGYDKKVLSDLAISIYSQDAMYRNYYHLYNGE